MTLSKAYQNILSKTGSNSQLNLGLVATLAIFYCRRSFCRWECPKL